MHYTRIIISKKSFKCEYFIIFDTDTNSYEAIPNAGVNASGGAGIKAANQIIEAKANVLITGNLGPNAFELIEKSKIKAVSCEVMPVNRAIELYQKNMLSDIFNAGVAHHGMR